MLFHHTNTQHCNACCMPVLVLGFLLVGAARSRGSDRTALGLRGWDKVRPQGPNKFMVVVYDHTVQEHHFVSSGTLMALTCDLLGTKIGETAQCDFLLLGSKHVAHSPARRKVRNRASTKSFGDSLQSATCNEQGVARPQYRASASRCAIG